MGKYINIYTHVNIPEKYFNAATIRRNVQPIKHNNSMPRSTISVFS